MAIIGPEDYLEPACLLCGEQFGEQPKLKPIPQERIIAKMDEYMGRRDYAGAERHLLYWLEEAKAAGDKRGELMVRGELVGHYRKTSQREKAFENIEAALRLIDELEFQDTISAGTTYVNCATAACAFGDNARALTLFNMALPIYESKAATRAELLGGLYNNMGLTLTALGKYPEAGESFEKALYTMSKVPGGSLEEAMTLLNKADLISAEYGMENAESKIYSLLDEALSKLENTDAPRDGYYAFVLEKCAPVFEHYGYFAAAQKLSRRSEEIYERA